MHRNRPRPNSYRQKKETVYINFYWEFSLWNTVDSEKFGVRQSTVTYYYTVLGYLRGYLTFLVTPRRLLRQRFYFIGRKNSMTMIGWIPLKRPCVPARGRSLHFSHSISGNRNFISGAWSEVLGCQILKVSNTLTFSFIYAAIKHSFSSAPSSF